MQKQGNDISKAAGEKAWSVEEKEKKTLNWQKRKKNSFRHQTDKVCLSISFLCAYCFFPVAYNRKQARVLWAIFSFDFKQRRLETRRSIQTQSKWNVEFGSFVYICLSISTLNETKNRKIKTACACRIPRKGRKGVSGSDSIPNSNTHKFVSYTLLSINTGKMKVKKNMLKVWFGGENPMNEIWLGLLACFKR